MRCLNRCFLFAFDALAVRQDDVGAFAKQALKQTCLSAKGRPGIFQWVPEATKSSRALSLGNISGKSDAAWLGCMSLSTFSSLANRLLQPCSEKSGRLPPRLV